MGASAGIMMASSMAGQGVSSIGTAYSQSQAMRSQGEYQQRVAETNESLSKFKAQDAIDRGNRASARNDMQTKRLIGSQRAALASQGIDVNVGSAADVQEDSRAMGALDSLTIRNNAWREAWGYRVQASNDSYQGKFSRMAADSDADNTLLTGGMKAVSSGLQAGYYYKKG